MTSFLKKRIKKLFSRYRRHSLLRERIVFEKCNPPYVIIKGKMLLNFGSNDYLQLANHPQIKKAVIYGTTQDGIGSGSSAMISGYTKVHAFLEEKFAEFLNRERALLFNSGYLANVGVITALAERNSLIIADKYCHASMYDGILLSRANFNRYHHNDYEHAEKILAQKNIQEKIWITESVFSIPGTIAPINKIATLAKKYNALLIVDDAHGIGVLGENGKGICEYQQLREQDVHCLITPFGKAMGSLGAIVSGEKNLLETILQLAKTYRYTTALPPAICHGVIQALNILQKESWRREKLNYLIHFFIHETIKRRLKLLSADHTPIKSLLVNSNEMAIKIQQKLIQKGFFVANIRPPTVPKNSSCLRISLNCLHNEKQIITLLDEFKIEYENLLKHS